MLTKVKNFKGQFNFFKISVPFILTPLRRVRAGARNPTKITVVLKRGASFLTQVLTATSHHSKLVTGELKQ